MSIPQRNKTKNKVLEDWKLQWRRKVRSTALRKIYWMSEWLKKKLPPPEGRLRTD